uniref:Beta-galactosidase n=1 Tax=Craspedostauros australis TaxID=1486917 RepID=A0A7R9ZKE6_9STRA
MCFGLSASNTVETCNGDCTGYWVEQHGDSGRIQIDQPALLTEFENGFQIWGENASQPTDYFWGRTSRNTGQEVLKWFARGGAHLNYYMWWGGYNRGRSAAAGISNMYAADGVLCPSGQRHHPKFEYLQSLHDMLATIAPALLHRDSALHQDKDLLVKNSNGEWALQGDQRMFEYGAQNTNGPGKDGDGGSENGSLPHVIFVENDANFPVTAWVYGYGAVSLSPASVTVIVDGAVEFDSAIIDGQAEQYQRIFDEDTASELSWTTQPEPLRLSEKDKKVTASTEPIEQTALNIASDVSSDYAWYETNITLNADMDDATLHIDTAEANSFVAYIDGQYVAEANRHFHKEGLVTLDVPIGGIDAGVHRLLLLSESLGYDNLIGRWGVDTKRKMKGIVGSVVLGGSQDGSSTSIVVQSETMASGRRWLSFPGLHWDLGNIRNNNPNDGDDHDGSIEKTDVAAGIATSSVQARWAQTTFQTPPFDSPHRSLFLKVSEGRGHIWLNGHDLGRFWNITKAGSSNRPTQLYYQLPPDYLNKADGDANDLTIFDVFGSAHVTAQLVLSSLEVSAEPNFKDEVDYLDACI